MTERKTPKVLGDMLDKCVSLMRLDHRIDGAYVVGSVADGTADDYSDIDLYIVVRDEYYANVYEERFKFAEQVGDVLSTFEVEWPNCQMLGVIYENYVEVDLCYTKLGQAEVFSDRYRIVLDKAKRVQKALVKKHYAVDVKSELKSQTEFALYNVLHAINMWHKGEYWSSIKQVETVRKRIVSLVDLSLNRDIADEYRRLESVFPLEVEAKLRGTLCLYEENAIKKSIVESVQLFCEVGEELAGKLGVEFPSEKFSHLLKHLGE